MEQSEEKKRLQQHDTAHETLAGALHGTGLSLLNPKTTRAKHKAQIPGFCHVKLLMRHSLLLKNAAGVRRVHSSRNIQEEELKDSQADLMMQNTNSSTQADNAEPR
ncbi:unnamed protein product [Pleuronectes platessa]|uniref:Uncharacterized protein n=1 Tax=Pleuronectes platessa TaxID=8262 RepID=A0A9N7VDN4_PLEPL|nr:unnamed protein product [Pleuronectes platessa]